MKDRLDHIDVKTTYNKKRVFKKKMDEEGRAMSREIKRLIKKEYNITL